MLTLNFNDLCAIKFAIEFTISQHKELDLMGEIDTLTPDLENALAKIIDTDIIFKT